MKKEQVIILLGRSGSGKGTQAKMLINDFGFEYLGTGALLRERAEERDFTGRKIEKVINKGDLVPTFLVFNKWIGELEKIRNKKGLKGIVIDGSPRKVFEAELMDTAFDWFELKNIKVILVDISQKESYDRLTKRRHCRMCGQIIPFTGEFKTMKICNLCGGELVERADDSPKAIRTRMTFFKKEVEPVIKYYQKQKRLVRVDGEKSIDDVYADVKKAVKK